MLVTDNTPREIDLATAPAFLATMRDTINRAENRGVVIDCSGITFMDSSGFHALMNAHAYAIEHDRRLVISGLAENCARVIRICDPDRVLRLAEPRAA